MMDSKPEKKDDKNLDKSKSTLSLKGLDIKSFNKPASNPTGPVVELRQKRRVQNNNPSQRASQSSSDRSQGSRSGGYGNSQHKQNVSNPLLSRAEQDARSKALVVAREYQEKENQRRLRQEEDDKIREQNQVNALNEVSDKIESPENISSENIVGAEETKKKNTGPRVLGSVDLNRFSNQNKKISRLEDRDNSNGQNNRRFSSNNNSNNKSDDYRRNPRPNTNNNNNNQAGGQSGGYRNSGSQQRTGSYGVGDRENRPYTPRDNNQSDNRPQNRRPYGTSSTPQGSNPQRPDFPNQRASFGLEAIPSIAKSAPRKMVTKVKAKPTTEENEASALNKKGINASKDRNRKLTIVNAYDENYEAPTRSMAAHRRHLNKKHKATLSADALKVYREVTLPDTITVQDLASRMSERSADVVKELMKLGMIATLNKVLDADTAILIIETMGHTYVRVSEADVENVLTDYQDDEATLMHRAPVVTIMGHVDHGKTSLLDALRKTNVVMGEAGGITQHIGAYQVKSADGRALTFIDTPGHAAFSEMRSRGAKVTDIVILVVAADDGVKLQTIEAIKHAKAAQVPIIVAINKIDKPGADPNRVRTELLQHEIVVEAMGGDVIDVEISAKQKLGLENLIDMLLLQAEVLELRANPNRYAQGVVVEAELSIGRGAVATVLIQHGTLRVGDILVAGSAWGRVRALQNDLGQRVDEAGPSVPVEVLGLASVPMAGDACYVMENDSKARELAEYREALIKEKTNLATARTLDNLMSQIKDANKRSLPVIIKGDVQGSVEAISAALAKLGNEEVQVQVVHSGAGGITESDINLAEASGGVVLGFNVRANKQAKDLSENRQIEIRYYSIIYNLIDDVKAALSGLLKPERREIFLGNAEILQVFEITKVGKVAGCRVREGMAKRSAKVRLIRDDVVIHEGVLSTLRRFKDEVKEVQQGYECGMAFESYHDIRAGDMIEIFEVQEIARQL